MFYGHVYLFYGKAGEITKEGCISSPLMLAISSPTTKMMWVMMV